MAEYRTFQKSQSSTAATLGEIEPGAILNVDGKALVFVPGDLQRRTHPNSRIRSGQCAADMLDHLKRGGVIQKLPTSFGEPEPHRTRDEWLRQQKRKDMNTRQNALARAAL